MSTKPDAALPLTDEWAAKVLGIPTHAISVAEFSEYQRERVACVLRGARAALSEARPVLTVAAREALTLAANRMDRLALELEHGSAMRYEATEWAQEARASAHHASASEAQPHGVTR